MSILDFWTISGKFLKMYLNFFFWTTSQPYQETFHCCRNIKISLTRPQISCFYHHEGKHPLNSIPTVWAWIFENLFLNLWIHFTKQVFKLYVNDPVRKFQNVLYVKCIACSSSWSCVTLFQVSTVICMIIKPSSWWWGNTDKELHKVRCFL